MARFPYRLPGLALIPGIVYVDDVEKILTERAESLGVTILRGKGVVAIASQDEHSVTVETGRDGDDGDNGRPSLFRGRYLVGCDGGRSLVRKAAGFEFAGTEARFTGYTIKCELDNPGKLARGFNLTPGGMYFTNQLSSISLLDFDSSAFDRTTNGSRPITRTHAQDVITRVTGIPETELKISTFHLATSFTDRARQATTYRRGRILLAGDAAHIHAPLGGQGMNLGWKLAATVRRESSKAPDHDHEPLALLDSYGAEREPVGLVVLEWTRAQIIAMSPDAHGAAVRSLMADLLATADGTNLALGRSWGLSLRYSLNSDDTGGPSAHPCVGCSAPDFELSDGSRLGEHLGQGRGLLFSLSAGDSDTDDTAAALKDLVVTVGSKYAGRVDYLAADAKDTCGLRALLIRPDGVVAWVAAEGEAKPDVDAARAALERWFASAERTRGRVLHGKRQS